MLKYALIGAAIVALTVLIHAGGTLLLLKASNRLFVTTRAAIHTAHPMLALVAVVIVLLALHSLQIVTWAWAYQLLLPDGAMQSFEEAVYFSFVTFTTLGYGDVTLSRGWRLLAGIEALNGILLVGWSTAMLFAFIQRLWHGREHPSYAATDTGDNER